MLATLLSLLAPNDCLGCLQEGYVICKECAAKLAPPSRRCFSCYKQVANGSVCETCRQALNLDGVYVAASYEGLLAKAIKAYKFEHIRAAAADLVCMLDTAVPQLGSNVLVCHVPTATSRVRERGFDHAKLLAKEFASIRGLAHYSLLSKKTQHRQVGSTRSQRLINMKNEFEVTGKNLYGAHILLLDDVITTGSTIVSAVKALKYAGATRVDVAVLAQKIGK